MFGFAKKDKEQKFIMTKEEQLSTEEALDTILPIEKKESFVKPDGKPDWEAIKQQGKKHAKTFSLAMGVFVAGGVFFQLAIIILDTTFSRRFTDDMDHSRLVLYNRAVKHCNVYWFYRPLEPIIPALRFDDADCSEAKQDFELGPNASRDAGKTLSHAATLALQYGDGEMTPYAKKMVDQVIANNEKLTNEQALANIERINQPKPTAKTVFYRKGAE